MGKRKTDVMEMDEEFETDAEEAPRQKFYTVTENLKVDLTPEEILAASREMARAVDELHDLEQQRKAAAETYKARITQAQATVQINSVLVRNGYEFRKTEVRRTLDYDRAWVTSVRLDTGEVVESRAMTPDEKQMTF
jgi:hypothetical protein